METICNRCHQPVDADSCYCPTCGLPQLVYTNENNGVQTQQEKSIELAVDAGTVLWKPALRAAMLVAIPAGLLSAGGSPVEALGLFWMSAAAAWAVMIYVRGQQPRWITMGAGARIGAVTGLLAGGVAFAGTGFYFFFARKLGQGKAIDEVWENLVAQISQQWHTMYPDPPKSAMVKELVAWLRTPEAQAGWILCGMTALMAAMLAFAAIGGALGARLLVRSRRSQV
jgi:hypothetical protein